jgi:anthranilate phosphoribosyltransferase
MHRFIKAVGSGQKRARDLLRDEAREAMGLVADGKCEPVQVGAFLLALRMKGEGGEELAGFADALTERSARGHSPPGTLDVDCHGDGHEGRRSALADVAAELARAGTPVLLRVDLGNPYAKHGLAGSLATLGFDGPLDVARAERDLRERRLAVLDLATYCAPLERLCRLRPLFGVRTVAQTLCKLLDPLRASSRLAGVFHAPYLEPTARALALVAPSPALVVQALGGLPEATAGKHMPACWAGEDAIKLDWRETADAPIALLRLAAARARAAATPA